MGNSDLKERLSLAISRLPIINVLKARMDCLEIEKLKKSLLSIFLSNLSEKQVKYDLVKLTILENLFDVLEVGNIELDARSIYNAVKVAVEIAREFHENESEYFNSFLIFKDYEEKKLKFKDYEAKKYVDAEEECVDEKNEIN